MSNLDLTGKVAIVTGSSRGIGLSIAKKLSSNGASIIINGVSNLELLEKTAEEISEQFNCEVVPALYDVSTPEGAQDLVKMAFSKFRRLDIMVNNAGILQDSLIGMINNEDVDKTLDINLKGVIYGTQAAARLMKRNSSGSIINTSSIIGRYGNAGQLVYGASKAGVIGATRSAGKELAEYGIRVNAIAPGYIKTDMIKDIPAHIHTERMESIAMKRIGEASDIANVALFLASDLSSYITGQVIGVDGGMVI